MISIRGALKLAKPRKPSLQGNRASFPIFSTLLEKLLPAKVAAFFTEFISVQHQVASRAPMNSSLVSHGAPQGAAWSHGRVFLISSLF
ncbi:MAG: hypothetical protein EBX16_01950 [Burkholderiaceae bacterium]|nr:hypothetical protein [Burkholderiaceae bacterium]